MTRKRAYAETTGDAGQIFITAAGAPNIISP